MIINNIDDLYEETKIYIKYLDLINKSGYITMSSQPGHDINNYNNNEHTYKYGYGYISGYISKYNKSLINNFIKLSHKYIVIIDTTVYYNDIYVKYNDIPIYPIGNNKNISLKYKNTILGPKNYYTHTFPPQFNNEEFIYVTIQYPNVGNSNIFKDIYDLLL